MQDLVIRKGMVVDGSGGAPFIGDVAVHGGRIVAVGQDVTGRFRRTINADGALVTPGFVDIHTHYDGQVTWDDALEPSASHGVTTIVTGNCGVGFAPVRPGQRDMLIELMEGVEDIPGTALHEGIRWNWESFEEYLDYLQTRQWSMDVGTQLPHGALRAYVMGERGVRNEAACAEDIEQMAGLTERAMRAGALGFSTSRILGHQSVHGEPVPGTFASEDETFAIGRVLARFGSVFELVPGGSVGQAGMALGKEARLESELAWMARLSRKCALPITFLTTEFAEDPEAWRRVLDEVSDANRRGARLHPQTASRPAGILVSWQSAHVFERRPTYQRIKNLPLSERVRQLAKPEVKAAILAEDDLPPLSDSINDSWHLIIGQNVDSLFPLGNPLNYEPRGETAVGHQARTRGVPVESLIYDLMMADQGRAMLMMPALNYARGNCDALYGMMTNEHSILGLGDGGAHCRLICDASATTHLLTHWVRDRTGEKLTLGYAIKKQCADTAALYGLHDRGHLRPGMRADINVIDFDNLSLELPFVTNDLPAAGQRFLQRATGYIATLVAGEVTREHDCDTGARPGRLVRGKQRAMTGAGE